jgi:myosin-5
VLGFTAEIQSSIWRTLAGILLLGNIDFVPGKASDSSEPKDPSLVATLAGLWKVEEAFLLRALVTRTFATGVGNKSTLRKGDFFFCFLV